MTWDWYRGVLVTRRPRSQQDTPAQLRRRQWVVAGFGALGALVLAVSLRIEPGNPWFYPATFSLAAVWLIGALLSGRLHLGRELVGQTTRRPIASGIAVGLLLAGIFLVGALLVQRIQFLAGFVDSVMAHADEGSLALLVVITTVNGIAEEVFFRGAAYAAITRHPVVWTTVIYTAITAVTGNLMLVFAAALLGAVTGLERRATGGLLAPILTHVAWSLTMLLVLPRFFG